MEVIFYRGRKITSWGGVFYFMGFCYPDPALLNLLAFVDNRKQKTENRKQKTENRKQKTENRK